ncbi:MAG: hypothetical protein N4A31_06440 [Rickettsiales bacterium]|jgi:hypothetical protein|nr:hypothetical protein [Rickettsiales bacterium]
MDAVNGPWGTSALVDNFYSISMYETVYLYCYSGETVAGLRVLGYDAVSVKSGMGAPVTDTRGWADEAFDVVQ